MPSLASLMLKRFFGGTPYYAIGRKITTTEGRDEVAYTPVMQAPTERLVEQHLLGEIVLGAYTLRADNTVGWMAFDVDASSPEKARDLTFKLDNVLAGIPHVIEFSGRKGYHVWIFFRKNIEADRIRALAQEIRESVGGKVSGDPHIEIFPKQDRLTETNPLGNLVKIPLGVHPISGGRSKFVFPIGSWEEGLGPDPTDSLDQLGSLEDLAMCLEGFVDPKETIISTLLPFWTEGQRHDLALYLSGWLATSSWEEEDAMTVVERLQEQGGGDLTNQLRCVTDTYQKFRDGGQVLGLQALSERLPGTILRKLAEAISRQNITPVMILIDKIRNNKGPTYLKSRSAASSIIAFLSEKGKVLIDATTDSLFWLDRTSHHLYSMEDSWWDTLLYNTFGLNTSDNFGHSTERGVYHTARETAEKVRTHSRSHWDGDNLWINLGSSYNYILSGEEPPGERWGRKILNGEEGMIFRTRDSSLKLDLDESLSRNVKPLSPWKFLVNDLNFGFGANGTSPDQQKELIKAWFLSTFFPNVMPTRPLLTIIADPGAGKTTAARRFLFILEGPHANVNGLVGDKPDSLRASIAAHKFLVLDNIEKSKRYETVDLLNRVSTGTDIELRKLHTTNEIQRIKPDCFIILTATSLPFAEESLFTRMLPVELATITNPIPEYIMQRSILDNIDGIWMGILDLLNPVIKQLKSVRTAPAPTETRLADFSVFCARIQGLQNGADGVLNGEVLLKGLEMMTNRQKVLLHESSPFIQILDMWLRQDREAGVRQGRGDTGVESQKWHSASDLNSILGSIAQRSHHQWIWENGHSLSKHIQALEPNLKRNFGMTIQPATNNSPKKYRFKINIVDFTEIEIPDNQPKNVE